MPVNLSLPLPVTHHLVKNVPLEYQGLIVSFFNLWVAIIYQRVSCRGEVLIKEFCYSRKLLGNTVEEAHKHWHVVVAHDNIDPVVKACTLSFSIISTPETTAYLQKHWNDLRRQTVNDRRDKVHGSPDYQIAHFIVQYALSWARVSGFKQSAHKGEVLLS